MRYIESPIHIQVYNDIMKLGVPCYHFTNEGKRKIQTAVLLKRMGMKPGVYDLFMPRGNGLFKGLWLEVKPLKGRASPAQIQFGKDMKAEGYDAHIGYGYEECIFFVREFYKV